jgi:hypothetical protein
LASLQQDLQNAGLTSSSGISGAGGAGKLAQDFNSLGQALQSGNLADAQQAWASVQLDMRNTYSQTGHHGRHHTGAAGQGGSSDFSSLLNSLLSSETGDLSSASGSSSPAGSTQTGDSSAASSTSNSLAQDFTSLVQALQSGNLSNAQKAYGTVLQDFQSALTGQSNQQTGAAGAGFSMEYASISIDMTTYSASSLSSAGNEAGNLSVAA